MVLREATFCFRERAGRCHCDSFSGVGKPGMKPYEAVLDGGKKPSEVIALVCWNQGATLNGLLKTKPEFLN